MNVDEFKEALTILIPPYIKYLRTIEESFLPPGLTQKTLEAAFYFFVVV